MRSSLIPVRGTRYYQARAAKTAGRLRKGTSLILVRQPENPHDSTAVAICLRDGTMLGYVPKERSAEFFEASLGGDIVSASIHAVRTDANEIAIDAKVEFSSPAPRKPRAVIVIPGTSSRGQPLPDRPRPRLPPPIDTPPPPTSQVPSGPAEGGSHWLWLVAGAIIVIWLLGK
jgi:hypothetical protein